ncbi:hypothetical protein ACRYCC_07175 [Actinomadura scrupuli]|uniref:hypothetical protein n=1 Tax=Actinomadura scrupuli TaxID=559629 RepID=UPI003D956825
MASDVSAGHRSNTARRVGYLIAAGIGAALLYALNVRPGWDALPFLTDETSRVLGLLDLSLVAGLIFNLGYVLHDPPWLKSLGDLVTTGIGLVVQSVSLARAILLKCREDR